MEIKGKAAIATGASSDDGIGAECAKILASRGCNVLVNYATNKAGADKVVAHCQGLGVDAIAVQGDVSKDADCVRLVKTAVDRWGRLDVLINNAAITKPIPHKRMDLLDAAEFQRVYGVNLIGNYQMCRAAAPHLKATGDAAIVNISSVGAMRAGGSSMAYTASKAALNNLTLSMARAAGAARCGSMRSARAACWGTGPARSSTRSSMRSGCGGPRRSSRSARASGRSTWRARRCSWSRSRPS